MSKPKAGLEKITSILVLCTSKFFPLSLTYCLNAIYKVNDLVKGICDKICNSLIWNCYNIHISCNHSLEIVGVVIASSFPLLIRPGYFRYDIIQRCFGGRY